MTSYIHDFCHLRPPFQFSQDKGLKWLVDAHVHAEKKGNPELLVLEFRQKLQERVDRVACKMEHIQSRGYSIPDITHDEWEGMGFFGDAAAPHGSGFGIRNRLFQKKASTIFEEFYGDRGAPEDLIHVTCTGYFSPSPGQKMVAKKGWKTRVTHAYHMGCFAAIPAMRIAQGFLAAGRKSVDVVHTEMCSLHFNPALHDDDQLVSQSLFADGFIRYQMSHEPCGFRLLAVQEELLPDTADQMTWGCEDWGLKMTLAREVPYYFQKIVSSFVEKLGKADYFAIHPGGPKIIDRLQKKLELSDIQVLHSREVLRQYGNMSSATLPHILELMDKDLRKGERVIGLAFGPGLTIVGILLEKV